MKILIRMSAPIVSVIIPCYKGEKYIGSCLDMMFSQSYKNLEIIVIIDGILDNTEEIASAYPVKIIRFEQNRGLSAGRNAGIAAATGKYIHFMDVDDRINKDFYLNMVQVSEETGADISCASMYNEKSIYQSQIFNKRKIAVSTKEKLKISWVSKWGYVWRYLFNLEFIKNTGILFEEGRLIEDMPFSFRMLYLANKIVSAKDAVYFYADVPGSILNNTSKKISDKRREDLHHAKEIVSKFAKEKGIKQQPGRSFNLDKLHYIFRKYYIILFKKNNIRQYIMQLFPEQIQSNLT